MFYRAYRLKALLQLHYAQSVFQRVQSLTSRIMHRKAALSKDLFSVLNPLVETLIFHPPLLQGELKVYDGPLDVLMLQQRKQRQGRFYLYQLPQCQS